MPRAPSRSPSTRAHSHPPTRPPAQPTRVGVHQQLGEGDVGLQDVQQLEAQAGAVDGEHVAWARRRVAGGSRAAGVQAQVSWQQGSQVAGRQAGRQRSAGSTNGLHARLRPGCACGCSALTLVVRLFGPLPQLACRNDIGATQGERREAWGSSRGKRRAGARVPGAGAGTAVCLCRLQIRGHSSWQAARLRPQPLWPHLSIHRSVRPPARAGERGGTAWRQRHGMLRHGVAWLGRHPSAPLPAHQPPAAPPRSLQHQHPPASAPTHPGR